MLAGSACRGSPPDLATILRSPTAVARAARLEQARAHPDTAAARSAPLAEWLLPHALQEISGLALTSDGRLFAHDDEVGQIWEVDPRRGVLVKRFMLGARLVKDDFEGMAIAHDAMFLLASSGKLYEFREGANFAHVDYQVHETGLRKACEFEGVAFDPAIDALLLACKQVFATKLHDALVIYRWSLTGDSSARISQLTVPLGDVLTANGWKELHPSDITVDPRSGNYVLIASLEHALISITPAGAVVFARALPALNHQPEGLAITQDSLLIVSDEAGRRPAIITLSRWP